MTGLWGKRKAEGGKPEEGGWLCAGEGAMEYTLNFCLIRVISRGFAVTKSLCWVPAFAGMTGLWGERKAEGGERGAGFPPARE